MPRGGKRKGAGRKPEFEKAKVQCTVRLPSDHVELLVDDFGGVQAGVQTLVIHYAETKEIPLDQS